VAQIKTLTSQPYAGVADKHAWPMLDAATGKAKLPAQNRM
jgi:hypothetical protein